MRQFGKFEYGLSVVCCYYINVDFPKCDNEGECSCPWEMQAEDSKGEVPWNRSVVLDDMAKGKGLYKYIESWTEGIAVKPFTLQRTSGFCPIVVMHL